MFPFVFSQGMIWKKLKFFTTIKFGKDFFYRYNDQPDKMVFYSRLAVVAGSRPASGSLEARCCVRASTISTGGDGSA